MDTQAVIAALYRACQEAGSASEWARINGVTRAYVSQVLAGKTRPGPSILRPLGFAKSVQYRREHKQQ